MPTTRIDIPPGYAFASYAERQKLYLDGPNGDLIPNTELWEGDVLQMRVNALGCKGENVVPGLPAIVCFGDSTTMGHCFVPDSWPAHVTVPGYSVLNAAVEGFDMELAATRFERFRTRVDLAAAVVYVGWHNIVYNRTDEEYWEEQLSRFLGDHVTAYCTIATCLTEEFRTRGILPLLNTAPGADLAAASQAASLDLDYFNFWMDLDPAEWLEPILDGIDRYNGFVRRFCSERRAALIDLHGLLEPARWEDAPADFYDVCHLRPRAYDKVGACVSGVLAGLLPSQEPVPARVPT